MAQQAASQYDGSEVGLEREARPNASATIIVSVTGPAEAAMLLGERHTEQSELGILLPKRGAVALGLFHVARGGR